MNNRIQELINECTETLRGYDYRRGNYTETYFDKEKFAELMIKECITVLKEQQTDFYTIDNLKRYFGVEL